MIQYRKLDGTLGEIDPNKLYKIDTNGNTFKVTLKYYGWDEYDFWYDEIPDIIELRIG
jgi:hypothetical protein